MGVNNRKCVECGAGFYVKPSYEKRRPNGNKFCSKNCWMLYSSKPRVGPIDSKGYVTLVGKRVRLHRWAVEQYIGRKLSTNEHIHHINGNKLDNRIENLEVLTPGQHRIVHRTIQPHICDICKTKKYYSPSVSKRLGKIYRCIICRKNHGFADGTGPHPRAKLLVKTMGIKGG